MYETRFIASFFVGQHSVNQERASFVVIRRASVQTGRINLLDNMTTLKEDLS